MVHKCVFCNINFEERPYDSNKFCSHKCYIKRKKDNAEKNKIDRICLWCGSKFRIKKAVLCNKEYKAKFCSCECYWKSMKGKGLTKNLGRYAQKGEMVGINSPTWKGGGRATVEKHCKQCGKKFSAFLNEIRRGGGKFCSQKCQHDWLSESVEFSEKIKKLWRNKEYREKTSRAALKALAIRPTRLEKQMIDIIQKHNLPYKYTGDGDFWIGGKNPDFVNINGEKKLIEVANNYDRHHPINYAELRNKHFAKYGWQSYIFIGRKLDENEVLNSIKN